MRRLIAVLFACALLIPALFLPAQEKPAEEPAMPAVSELAFMSGAWAADFGPRRVEETWSAPSADSMVATCRFLNNGKMTLFEALTIETHEDGVFMFLMHYGPGMTPKHDDPMKYRLAKVEGTRAEFQNTAEDFPAFITYELKDGVLTAALLDTERTAKQSFAYRRAAE